jgi:dTDP-4-dehydrorhamnose reductase
VKILLFGKNGQLGWELQRSLAPLGELFSLDRHGYDGACGDLTDVSGVANTVRRLQPDVIVNAAAYTAVDKAETETEAAYAVNVEGPRVLAQAAAESDALLVHYSTDYVFDGSGDRPWRETDSPAPLSVYGQTKLEGERAIQASGCRHLIFRTSWVYAARGGNFAKTMLRLAAERDSLSVIEDQIGAPTGAELIADMTAHAVVRGNSRDAVGVYHLAAGGETSWHAYAAYVLQLATEAGMALKVKPADIAPIPSSAYKVTARRPLNSRLDTSKLRQIFGLSLPTWQQGVARMLTEILEK